MPIPDEAELRALVGTELPGGRATIAHWENHLLTEATGSPPLPDDLAHPVHLFHVPIAGVGVTLAELFALGRAEDDGAISIDYYDWELMRPLREDEPYTARGRITEFTRDGGGDAPIRDSLTFRIELEDDAGAAVAVVTFRWHYWRFRR